MRTQLFLIIICVLFTIKINAQDVSKIIGTYAIHEVRSSITDPGWIDTIDYEIKIEPSTIDSFDFQYYLPDFIFDTVRATLLNDSAFQISLQIYYYYDSIETLSSSIYGEGIIHNDSIIINHDLSEEYIGLFIGYCRGIKKNGTGIYNQTLCKSNVLFYPNPTKNSITISNPLNTKIKKIELIDLSGRIVQQWNKVGNGENIFQIKSVFPGMYLLKMETEFGIETEKLVVQ